LAVGLASKLIVKDVGEPSERVPIKVELPPSMLMPRGAEAVMVTADAGEVPELSNVPVIENMLPGIGAAGSSVIPVLVMFMYPGVRKLIDLVLLSAWPLAM
jgi:hypothetical protein